MLKIDRQTAIEQELAKNGSVLIPALSQLLQCSEETIRRDLRELEAGGKLTRTHGGAYLMEKYDKSYPTKLRKIYFQDVKSQMARCAFQYVKENDVLMLDSSTTCLELARLLVEEKYNVTIITNSLLICELCSERLSNINLVCLGGTFRRRTSSFTGYHTTDILAGYHADKAFISCPKITPEQGLSDNHLNEAKVPGGHAAPRPGADLADGPHQVRPQRQRDLRQSESHRPHHHRPASGRALGRRAEPHRTADRVQQLGVWSFFIQRFQKG